MIDPAIYHMARLDADAQSGEPVPWRFVDADGVEYSGRARVTKVAYGEYQFTPVAPLKRKFIIPALNPNRLPA